jgi:hypothetical protein
MVQFNSAGRRSKFVSDPAAGACMVTGKIKILYALYALDLVDQHQIVRRR